MTITINLNINSVSPGQLSVNGGRVTISGSGFPETWPNKYYNKMSLVTGGNNVALSIIEMTTSKIVFDIQRGFNSRSYTFSITSPLKLIKSTSFSQATSNTPTVVLTAPTNSIAANTLSTISLNRTNLVATTP